MIVAGLAIDTIRLRRAYDCTHTWVKLSDSEDQCTGCTIIATPEGKAHLQRMADRFHGRRPAP